MIQPKPRRRASSDPVLEEAADRLLAEAEGSPSAAERSGNLAQFDNADEPDPGIQDEPIAAAGEVPETSRIADPRADEIAGTVPDFIEVAPGGDLFRDEVSNPAASLEPGEDPEATSLAATPDEAAAAIEADGRASGPAGDAEPEQAAAPAEPETVEVWRLNRHNREQHPRGRHARNRPEPRGARPEGNRRPGGGHGHGQNRPGEPGQNRPGEQRRAGQPGGNGRGGEGGRERFRAEGGRPQGGPGRSGEERGPRRDERPRPEAGRRDERRPERRERPADPNSPFAALAALKAQLEAGDRNKS
jgi:ATP-dependent RNA helicase SUPV3L1/SUV3